MKILFLIIRLLKQLRLIRSRQIYKLYLACKKKINLKLLVTTRYGFKIYCDLQEWIDFNLFFERQYEKYESKYFFGAIKPNNICFDIGANIGYYSLLMKTKKAEVHAFEPYPHTFNRLMENININRYASIAAHNLAISDTKTTIKIYSSPDTIGNNSANIVYNSNNFVECETETLDNYCEKNGINFIDFLKVDVEGHEISVLRGAKNLLMANKIRQIFIEVKEIELDDEIASLIRKNYTIYIFSKKGPVEIPYIIDDNLLFINKEFPLQ